MGSAAYTRDVLKFDDRPVEIALKFATGKQISNGRVMFSTITDEVFFVSQDDADKIYELQLRPQENFRVWKEGRDGIAVERIPQVQRPVERPALATPAAPVEPSTKPNSHPQGSSLSSIMASSYISAIDALLVARDYAERKGVPFKLSGAEIRAAAHCCFIACTKGGIR